MENGLESLRNLTTITIEEGVDPELTQLLRLQVQSPFFHARLLVIQLKSAYSK